MTRKIALCARQAQAVAQWPRGQLLDGLFPGGPGTSELTGLQEICVWHHLTPQFLVSHASPGTG